MHVHNCVKFVLLDLDTKRVPGSEWINCTMQSIFSSKTDTGKSLDDFSLTSLCVDRLGSHVKLTGSYVLVK
jgi:hypothetical protein